MANTKKTAKQQTGYRIYSQYILVGAALGLYYGAFYRSTQDSPDYGIAVILAVLAGLITTVARSWKKKKSFREIALDFVKITAMFLVFLIALQLKSVLDRIGGRVLVIAAMTLVGMIFGLIIGVRRKPVQQQSR